MQKENVYFTNQVVLLANLHLLGVVRAYIPCVLHFTLTQTMPTREKAFASETSVRVNRKGHSPSAGEQDHRRRAASNTGQCKPACTITAAAGTPTRLQTLPAFRGTSPAFLTLEHHPQLHTVGVAALSQAMPQTTCRQLSQLVLTTPAWESSSPHRRATAGCHSTLLLPSRAQSREAPPAPLASRVCGSASPVAPATHMGKETQPKAQRAAAGPVLLHHGSTSSPCFPQDGFPYRTQF